MINRFIVEGNIINTITEEKCNKEIVGGKAFGLLTMPETWTPAFFVISKNLYKNFVECTEVAEREHCIGLYMPTILKCIKLLGLEHRDLIIRSSGVKEGMAERGKFESLRCNVSTIQENLVELILYISKNCVVPDNEMPFVVQEYIECSIIGHLSNEYRFSQNIRDWKFQYELNKELSDLKSLGVRNWRERIDADIIAQYPLEYTSMNKALRVLAAYYTNKKLRRHIEFIYDGKRLYAVQADDDIEDPNAIDPTKYDIAMNCADGKYEFKVLRYANESDGEKYNKIKNVFTYHSVGLVIVPLYILDDADIISSLSNDILPLNLEEDLRILLNRSIVIRSDITPYNQENAQLLKRSNELRNLEDVKNWLFENSKKILEKNGVFIFHNFIPSISAAFVYAKPNSRKVEIQSLWGLPEGLYYNAHDRIIVDTKKLEVDKLDVKLIKSKDIIKRLEYKPTCIFPEDTGEWKLNKIARPYNWKCSIQDDESIKQIAIDSRKIAEREKSPLSIMWFVEIDATYYHKKNIPWHHEVCTVDTYTNDSYKRKYFSDEEVVIKNEQDLEKLDKATYVKCIRIQPDNDQTLRDRFFIKKVGEIARKNDIMILLEGAVLAHSFYQLMNTGANVVVATKFEEYSEEIEFNKLVRDKIPYNIINGGEKVQCAVADSSLYLYLLLNKLIEETYEAYDAEDDELLSELVDIYEVCDSIINLKTDNILLIPRKSVIKKQGSNRNKKFSYKHYLENKECQTFLEEGFFFMVALTRKRQFFEVEIRVWDEHDKPSTGSHVEIAEKSLLTFLVDHASEMLSIVDISEIKDLAALLQNKIMKEILPQLQVSLEEFTSTRDTKLKRNGGFEKRYVLLKTKFSGETGLKGNIDENLRLLHELPQKGERAIELLMNNNVSSLLLRKKIPMEYITFSECFEHEKIEKFFGDKRGIVLYFEHQGDKISIELSQELGIDGQLELVL